MGSATTVDGTMTVAQALTSTGTLNVGAHIVATNTGAAKSILATTTNTVTIGNGPINLSASGQATAVDGTMTVAQTLAVTGVVTLTNDLIVNGGDITHATASTAANIYATTTALTTIGDGPVNIGKASSATTVDGTMTVAQALTSTGTLNVGAHIVATNTGAAKSILATTTNTVTIGNGPINLSASGQATAVDGTMTVAQTLAVTGVVTLTNDLIVNGGDITHATAS